MNMNFEKSASYFQRALNIMPSGNTRSTLNSKPHPIYIEKGAGQFVTDVDGNKYLDFSNNFTTLIHGHSFPPVVEALKAQVEKGLCFGNPTTSEVDFAELLCERSPYFENIRFMNTGSEAVMNAVKAARAITGRSKIAKYEGGYHGNYDVVEVSTDPTPSKWGSDGIYNQVAYHKGTPNSVLSDAIIFPVNDINGARKILAAHADSIAAILIDPIAASSGLPEVSRDYLLFLREFSHENGIILISDEVLSFRNGYSGAMANFDIEPDLCAFGKVIGGGLPIGAVAGRKNMMGIFDPNLGSDGVRQSGTFTANPVSMIAGYTAMQYWTKSAVAELNELGLHLREAMARAISDANAPFQVTCTGSIARLHFKAIQQRDYRTAYLCKEEQTIMARFLRALLQRGILSHPAGMFCLSTPMCLDDITQLEDAMKSAFLELKNHGL
ncbi:hypothetical protein B6S59_29820 [Pseudomonas sp. A46]|nr:aspartate aminotransferase family protein [Pseudomonas sp. A46]OWJ89715.1 hypothetical protein B6S59_29820 [Pseudomonas sp. A46]